MKRVSEVGGASLREAPVPRTANSRRQMIRLRVVEQSKSVGERTELEFK